MQFKHAISTLYAACALFLAAPAMAVDLDDDLKPETDEHIADEVDPSSAKSAEIEAAFPEEAVAVRKALDLHIAHVMARDLDGYMSDFLKDRIRYFDLEKNYAKRALELPNLNVEVKAVYFSRLTRSAATIHTRQISSYTDENGRTIRHDAIISYRWLLDAPGGSWRIAFTERQHNQ